MQSALQNKNWCSAVRCSESDCPRLRFNVSSIDFVRVTNCFYDYDYYDYKVKQQKDVSLVGAWRCRVSLMQWRWMAHCSRVQTPHRAATKKARSPIFERRDDGVTRADVDVDAERSRLLASMSASQQVQLVRLLSNC